MAGRVRSSQPLPRGMVTAELAVGLLTVAAIVIVMAWLAGVVMCQVRCIDTAAEVARQAARNDDAAVARATKDAPRGAQVSVTTTPTSAVAQVRLEMRPVIAVLPRVPLRADAEVLLETGAGE